MQVWIWQCKILTIHVTCRLRLHEEKQLLLQQLCDALRSMTQLESQLKTLSASTLSVSSSSSLGSLSTASSKGSLSSGLSFTDIYGGPQCLGLSNISVTAEKPVDMVDLHRRVERLLQTGSSESSNLLPSPSSGRSLPSLSPRSSLSSVSPPVSPLYDPALLATSSGIAGPPPAYDQVERQRRQQHLAVSSTIQQPQCLDRIQLEDRLAELRLSQQHIAAQLQQHDYVVLGGASGVRSQRALPPNIALADYLELMRGGNMSQGSGLGRPTVADPPLSPISETPPPVLDDAVELLQVGHSLACGWMFNFWPGQPTPLNEDFSDFSYSVQENACATFKPLLPHCLSFLMWYCMRVCESS